MPDKPDRGRAPSRSFEIMHSDDKAKSLIEFLRAVDTPTLSNAIETLKLLPKPPDI